MKKSYPIIEVIQPAGVFYLASVESNVLINIAHVSPRSLEGNGVQRDATNSRVKEISAFCSKSDAIFPTPIIISVDTDKADIINGKIIFDDDTPIGDVLDGQHRLLGLKHYSGSSQFQMPVAFMFNLTPEEEAYVFSIINSKQTKVNSSLIFDLFGVTDRRSPQKTAHELARSLNSMPESPFYNRLKMLGKKEEGQTEATLSQGSFAKAVMTLYSKHPEKDRNIMRYEDDVILDDDGTALRSYFIENKDYAILKILLNVFSALRENFAKEYEAPQKYILWKTTGFGGIIKALPSIIKVGIGYKTLTKDFFSQYFLSVKKYFDDNIIALTAENFGSGEAAQKKLADELTKPLDCFSYSKA